jgi:hypothetical protein
VGEWSGRPERQKSREVNEYFKKIFDFLLSKNLKLLSYTQQNSINNFDDF